MEIRASQKYCIITPLSSHLDIRETNRLMSAVNEYSGLKIGINMNYVEDCTIDFIEQAGMLNVGFFNVQSDMFSLMILMDVDKKTKIYTTEEDFITNNRRLLNRKFSLVKTA